MLKAIVFDFYGVICNDIGSYWYETRPPAELVPELKARYDKPADLGIISESEFFEGISRAVHASKEEVRKEWLDLVVINQELVGIMAKLKSEYRLALCSNTARGITREILRENNIEELFNVVVLSGEVGMIKPHADIFSYTLNKLGISADEVLFVDDREENIRAAEKVGMISFLYTGVNDLIRYLHKTNSNPN